MAAATATQRSKHGRPRRKRGGLSAFVGLLGELLITAGVIIGLYIVWQVWWTEFEGRQQQAADVAQLHDTVGTPAEQAGEPRYDEPPPFTSMDVNLDTGFNGMGIMHIPAFGDGFELPLVNSVGLGGLATGAVGHYPSTQLPGEVGNFATAGHRQTYGAPLKPIDEFVVGDWVIVESADAYYMYQVQEWEIVLPHQTEVIAPVPGEIGSEPVDRYLTLTTCHPYFYSTERWITYAEFDHWVDRSDGMPAQLLESQE